jgi:nucleoid-associated protein YgaU
MTQVINVLQGNLFQISATYLRDATQWVRIAALNGIQDPWLSGGQVITLILPDIDLSAGGGVGQQ